MPYSEKKDVVTLHMLDDEGRERARSIRVDTGLFNLTSTTDFADAFALMMRGTVHRVARSTTFTYDDTVLGAPLEIGTQGDVNDKTNLVFLNQDREKQVFPVYDLEQDCFVADEGKAARIVKPKSDLAAAAAGTPESYLNQVIEWVLGGTVKLGKGTALEYVEGYKAD